MKRSLWLAAVAALLILGAGCSSPKKNTSMETLQGKINRFAPTVITADTMTLSEANRRALAKLIEAMPLVDRLYLRQVWSGNEELTRRLKANDTPEGRQILDYFFMNMGPWSKLDNDELFVAGVLAARPPGANYYPERMGKEEFQHWITTLSDNDRAAAAGFFTVIRRAENGSLRAVPYTEEYSDLLLPLARLLRDAAAQSDNPSLRTYLLKRADALQSNNYYDSDVAWMQLDSPIDVTIGPYEVYLDELFNYKAAFEAYITIRNDAETAKLAKFSGYLQDIENILPINPRYRNPKLGTMAPIRVVDEVAIGGEARAGVQTAAFNLPNDERIVQQMGSKRVMLRNVQEAKFRKILLPIAGLAMDPFQQSMIRFEMFFTHILCHELMHGLGPHTIMVKGRATTVRHEMKELGSALEEAKADIAGLFALQVLIDRGVLADSSADPHGHADKTTLAKILSEQLYATYLAGILRTLRFGVQESHGKGMALQCNYLGDEGAIQYNETVGTFKINPDRMKEAVRKLTGEIMTIQAEGNYDRANLLLSKYGAIRPQMQRTLDKLRAIPIDIHPSFPLAGEVEGSSEE